MRITTAQINWEKQEHWSFSTEHITIYFDRRFGIIKHAIVRKNKNGEFTSQRNKYFAEGVKKHFSNIESLLKHLNESRKVGTDNESRADAVQRATV